MVTGNSGNDVWELVPLPVGKKAVGNKWVFEVKSGADGSAERYKARLVAQGFTQKYGTDYDETVCPVMRQESLRFLIILCSVWHEATSSSCYNRMEISRKKSI